MIVYNKYDSLGFLVNRAARSINNLFNKKLQEHDYPYKVDHFLLLNRIFENSNQSQQQLAEIVCIDKTTITRHLDLLENDKLIERKNDTADRRNKLVVLTPKGEAILHKIHNEIKTDIMKQLSSTFTKEEETELKRLLNKLYKNTEL